MSKKCLSITFVLPHGGTFPSGGPKVIYEHANGLARRGHQVAILHPAFDPAESLTPLQRGKRVLRYFQRSIDKSYRPDRWFCLDSGVRVLWAPSLKAKYIPDGDCVIATAWQTSEHVAYYPATKGKKYYFVQDYERFASAGSDLKARMCNTYKLGLHMAYISPIVKDMIISCGGNPECYVPNGINFEIYSKVDEVASWKRNMVGFPFRFGDTKRTADAIRALEAVRMQFPNIKVWSFGVKLSQEIPSWIEYYEFPTDRELATLETTPKIFVVPSHYEGWGLPGAEAMACGVALITTDNGGCHAYAEDGKTALIVPPKMPHELASSIVRLLQDEKLRVQLARAGNEYIQQFTWDGSFNAMERLLLRGVATGSTTSPRQFPHQ